MSVDLSDFVPSLLREVNPPGENILATTSDDDLVGYLADAFWEARLDGLLDGWSCDEDGIVTPASAGGADLPREGVGIVVLYAGIKLLRNRVLGTNTMYRAKAGSVEFEQQNSATLLVEMLKQLRDARKALLESVGDGGMTLVEAFDALPANAAYFSYLDGAL